MPKFASTFSSTVAPLWWPSTRHFTPSIVAKPAMRPRSSFTSRSPCSSSKSLQMYWMKSIRCGRFASRANFTLSIAVTFFFTAI